MDKQHLETYQIVYRFEKSGNPVIEYTLRVDRHNWSLENPMQNNADWTVLSKNQCPNCPLNSTEQLHCPAAINLQLIGNEWESYKSYDPIHVDVLMEGKTISGETTVQIGLSSLVGFLLATSDCPHLSFFRPLARFHQPLTQPESVGLRVLMSFLAYNQLKNEHNSDLKHRIAQIYENIEIVNSALTRRVEQTANENASVQAMVQLDCLSKLVPMSLDESYLQLEEIFRPYEQLKQGR